MDSLRVQGKPWLKVTVTDASQISVSGECIFCGGKHVISKINSKKFQDYLNGALIQRAFPQMPASDREFLISGICGPCFDSTFNEAE